MRLTLAMRDKVGRFQVAVKAGRVRQGEHYVVAINSRDADPNTADTSPTTPRRCCRSATLRSCSTAA